MGAFCSISYFVSGNAAILGSRVTVRLFVTISGPYLHGFRDQITAFHICTSGAVRLAGT